MKTAAEEILKKKVDELSQHSHYQPYKYWDSTINAAIIEAMEEYAVEYAKSLKEDKRISVETPIEFIWEKTNEDFDVRFCKIMDYTLKIRWIKNKERWAWCLMKASDLIHEPIFLRESENEAKLIAENSFLLHLISNFPSPPKTEK